MGIASLLRGCAAVLTATAVGTTAAAPMAAPTIESVAHDALVEVLAPALAARGASAIVNVMPSDARRGAAPCPRLEGFVPPGARLTGRTLVGVRCADGNTWQTFVTADVRVDAPVWQSTRALRAGEPIGAGDVTIALQPLTAADLEAALAASRGSRGGSRGLASLDGREAAPIGRIALRPIAMGRPLTASDVRDEGRLNAGEPVRVIYQGDGFAVTSEGRTVGPADPGGAVQVRLASGSVVHGLLRADHQVELPR